MNRYLFDFDGTLVDSMPVYAETILGILKEFSLPASQEVIKEVTPLGTEKTALYLLDRGVPLTKEEVFARMAKGMVEAYCYTIMPKPNVAETLKELKKRGKRLAVLTASPHLTLDPCLKRLGMYDLFDFVWSTDDFGKTKSDPSIFTEASEKWNAAESEVLFFDDNPEAARTGKRAGMKVCGVYDASSASFREEMKRELDFYVEDFSEILNF